jgi:phenylalanyl-tRNA synthetase beta chain
VLTNINWLKDWVDLTGSAEAAGDDLTYAGLEVEAIESLAPAFSGVVVGSIREVSRHPQADRLSLCVVDDGKGLKNVVCGAPNAAPGMRAPYARVGARLPGGRTIAAAEIRGAASQGMLCSARELGLGEQGDGLLVLDDDASIGAPLDAHLALDDAVLDIKITPNRGDCLSVLGIARELAAIRNVRLRGPRLRSVKAATKRAFPVQLSAAAACPRFAGRVIEGIEPGRRSPLWLTERLRRAGLRAIHPVVDVTNYVMLELGQPLHAYDLDALADAIDVRFATAGEALTLLDGTRLTLGPDVLVIADGKGPVGLGGIMGGARTGVTAATRNVFFEAAFFAPDAIRGRGRRYGLQTDAALRFERGVDPTEQQRAIERATELLQAIAGGRAGPTRVVAKKAKLPKRARIDLDSTHIEALLGHRLAPRRVEDILKRLDMRVAKRGKRWSVTPPAFRFDVRIGADLIEELARLVRYDNIPAVAGTGSSDLGDASEQYVTENAIADMLVARGYSEAITYGFIDAASEEVVNPGTMPVRVANPISSDLSVLRRSLWPGLLHVARQNAAHQLPRQRLFEVGTQFAAEAGKVAEMRVVAGLAAGQQWPEHWDLERRDADFFDVKSDVECLLEATGRAHEFTFVRAEHPALLPTQCARIRRGADDVGWIGALHPRVQKHFDLKSAIVLFALQIEHAFAANVTSYSRLSKYPSVRRDLAVVVDESVAARTLVEHVEAAAGKLLREVRVFDLYRGQGVDSRRKSIGVGLILQDASRTLTDEDADRTVDSVRHRLEHELGATIRT